MRLSTECREFLDKAELKITEIGKGKTDNSENEF
jgi:exonuclease VII small subunit